MDEEAPPSREQRANDIVAALEHAAKNNAPVTRAMIAEIHDLLGVAAPVAMPADPGDD